MRQAIGILLVTVWLSGWAQAADSPTSPKHPAPSLAELRPAIARVQDIFKDDIAQSRTLAQKAQLAEKLVRTAADTKDLLARYALLDLARQTAIQAGDPLTAMDTLRKMRETHMVPLSMDYTTLSAIVSQVQTPQPLVDIVTEMGDAAAREGDYPLAEKLLSIALRVSYRYRASSESLYKQVSAHNRSIGEISLAFTRIQPHLAKLKSQPGDPVANENVGSFYCFQKEDWAKGLPMLAKAILADQLLASTAAMELNDPQKPIELGDLWWRISDAEKGTPQVNIRKHAAQWYSKALPTLSGLEKVRVEKRIAMVGPTTKPATPQLGMATITATHAIAVGIFRRSYIEPSGRTTKENRVLSNRDYSRYAGPEVGPGRENTPLGQQWIGLQYTMVGNKVYATYTVTAMTDGTVWVIGKGPEITKGGETISLDPIPEPGIRIYHTSLKATILPDVRVVEVKRGDVLIIKDTGSSGGGDKYPGRWGLSIAAREIRVK